MKNKRLFFLGIDSATWDLIKPWVRQGKLPGFAKLLKTGTTLNLRSTIPPLTPVAWTSLYTGVNAGKHNVFDFYRMDKNDQININLASDNAVPTIFELLSQAQKKIAVCNLPFTYPVKPIKGLLLSGFLTPNLDSDFLYPRTLQKEFKKRFPDYRFTEKARYGLDKQSQQRYFQELIASVKQKIKAFDWVEAQANWDLMAVNFMEVDHVQHWFFKKKEKLLKVYELIDAYLLAKLNSDKYDQVMVFSDHGAGPYYRNLNLNTLFLQKGLLKLKNRWQTRLKKLLFDLGLTVSNVTKLALRLNRLPGSKQGRSQAQKIKLFLDLTDIDYERSIALAFGYYGNIYLLQKNEQAKTRVKAVLKALKYQGKPVIDGLWENKQVYSGPFAKNGPDLLYSAGNYSFGASAITPFLDNQVFSTPHTLKTGEHRPLGIFALSKRARLNNLKRKEINIYETSATMLDLLGISIPVYFEGQTILAKTNQKKIASDLEILKDLEL